MGFLSNYSCSTVLPTVLPTPLGILSFFFHRAKLAVAVAVSAVVCTVFRGSCPEEGQDFVSVELDLSLLPSFSKETLCPSMIKSRLRVLEFAGSCEEQAECCAVCLGELEARHEVRELGNCRHAFHKGCIDKWVDLGQDTCPLCRAHLLPYQRDIRESVWTSYKC